MKDIRWSEEKNRILKEKRQVSFEYVLLCISKGKLLDITDHPNRKRYPGQKTFIIEYNGYAYIVPFVESAEEIFLKTIIPSRKATRKYIKGGKSNEV